MVQGRGVLAGQHGWSICCGGTMIGAPDVMLLQHSLRGKALARACRGQVICQRFVASSAMICSTFGGARLGWPHQHACNLMPEHPPHQTHRATNDGDPLHAGGSAEPPGGTAIPLRLQLLRKEDTQLGKIWHLLAGLHTASWAMQSAVGWSACMASSMQHEQQHSRPAAPVLWSQKHVARALAAHLDAVLTRRA